VELPPGQGVERIGIAHHCALSRDCFQGIAGLAEDHDGLPSMAGIRLADRGLEQASQVAAALGNPAVKPTHDRDGGSVREVSRSRWGSASRATWSKRCGLIRLANAVRA
jgi:hypothetical protein